MFGSVSGKLFSSSSPAAGAGEPARARQDTNGADRRHHEREVSERTAPPRNRPSIGIALGGGAARGWAHIGVLRTLMEAGYEFDVVAGTSIGAVVGGCYTAGKLDDLENFATSLTRRRVFGLLDLNLGGSGLISGNRLSSLLQKNLGDTLIEELPRTFVAVATEMRTGHEIWLQRGHLVGALRASYALPGVFRPHRVMGRWLFDGAMVNPVPVSVCRGLGARLVIAVNLQSDIFGKGSVVPIVEEATSAAEPEADGPARTASALIKKQLASPPDGPPGISAVMMDALSVMQDRISRARLAGDPPDVTIGPKLRDIGLFEFHRAREAIDSGREAAERALDEIAEAVGILAGGPTA